MAERHFLPGLVVSPGAGLTLVNALRIYTANDTTQRDPADYELEGSVDGGHSYTPIASNSLRVARSVEHGGDSAGPLEFLCPGSPFCQYQRLHDLSVDLP